MKLPRVSAVILFWRKREENQIAKQFRFVFRRDSPHLYNVAANCAPREKTFARPSLVFFFSACLPIFCGYAPSAHFGISDAFRFGRVLHVGASNHTCSVFYLQKSKHEKPYRLSPVCFVSAEPHKWKPWGMSAGEVPYHRIVTATCCVLWLRKLLLAETNTAIIIILIGPI